MSKRKPGVFTEVIDVMAELGINAPLDDYAKWGLAIRALKILDGAYVSDWAVEPTMDTIACHKLAALLVKARRKK